MSQYRRTPDGVLVSFSFVNFTFRVRNQDAVVREKVTLWVCDYPRSVDDIFDIEIADLGVIFLKRKQKLVGVTF